MMISLLAEALVTDVLVRRIPEILIKSLKRRAARHRRSLQQELVTILESAANESTGQSAARIASAVRARLSRSGRTFSDSAALIREDRRR